MQYVWLKWSLLILGLWFMIYLLKKDLRKEMLWVSLWTTPLGLTEPLFVPEYWNPPSLFDLAQTTGFDIESLLFSFSIGGIGSVLYRAIVGGKQETVSEEERKHRRHYFHLYALLSPIFLFVPLALLTDLNHIYCGIIAMFGGAIAALYCRPDLKLKIWIGGLLFLLLYFFYFLGLNLMAPDYVAHVWNLKELSGVLIAGIPLEELLFAFSFGMFWSSLYEHLHWLRISD